MLSMKELIKELSVDKTKKGNAARYCCRFINLNLNIETYKLIMQTCSNQSIKIISIVKCLKHEDSIITKSLLLEFIKRQIKSCKDDILFIGLSEFLRLTDKAAFESVIRSLIEYENYPMSDRRIYFTIFSCFKEIARFNRIYQDKKYNPTIISDGTIDSFKPYNMFFVFNTNQYKNIITKTNDYYDLFIQIGHQNNDSIENIICNNKYLYDIWKDNEIISDDTFIIKSFDQSLNICEFYISEFNINKNYCFDDSFYDKLLEEIDIDLNSGKVLFEPIISKLVGLNDLNWKNVLNKFINGDKFIKQCCIMYYLNSCNNNDVNFLLRCIFEPAGEISNDSFFESIYEILRIEKIYSNKDILILRKQLIKWLFDNNMININSLDVIEKSVEKTYNYLYGSILLENDCMVEPIEFRKVLSNNDLKYIKIFNQKYCISSITEYTIFERKMIIWLFSNDIVNTNELQLLYSDVFNYLFYDVNNYFSEEYSDFITYFKEYNLSKIMNCATSNYMRNREKYINEDFDKKSYDIFSLWYNKLYDRKDAKCDSMFAFDGVGFEYFPYIISLLEKKDINILSCNIGKSKLPTTTEINKIDLNSIDSFKEELIKDYDKLVIHGDYYYYIENIEKSLRIIKNMIDNLFKKIKPGEIVSLTSDHGSTIQHKIIATEKQYAYELSEHDGRCCKINDEINANNSRDYFIYKDYSTDQKWIIATKNISLFNTPKYEAHGGATPEEVCIPLITFVYKTEIEYKINMLKETVNGLDTNISFNVFPLPCTDVYIKEKLGKYEKCILRNDSYCFHLTSGKTQKISIKILNKTYEIQITNNSMNEGDDFF